MPRWRNPFRRYLHFGIYWNSCIHHPTFNCNFWAQRLFPVHLLLYPNQYHLGSTWTQLSLKQGLRHSFEERTQLFTNTSDKFCKTMPVKVLDWFQLKFGFCILWDPWPEQCADGQINGPKILPRTENIMWWTRIVPGKLMSMTNVRRFNMLHHAGTC